VAGRRFPRGHDLLGIFVAQIIERECAALGDCERLREQRRRIDLPQTRQGPQMPLAIRKQREPRALKRDVQANRPQHVLQGAAAAPVHVHVAGGDPRQFERLTQRFEKRQAARIDAAGQEFDAYP
jgi:hypothetical protein